MDLQLLIGVQNCCSLPAQASITCAIFACILLACSFNIFQLSIIFALQSTVFPATQCQKPNTTNPGAMLSTKRCIENRIMKRTPYHVGFRVAPCDKAQHTTLARREAEAREQELKRRMMVNNIFAGGTNCHLPAHDVTTVTHHWSNLAPGALHHISPSLSLSLSPTLPFSHSLFLCLNFLGSGIRHKT